MTWTYKDSRYIVLERFVIPYNTWYEYLYYSQKLKKSTTSQILFFGKSHLVAEFKTTSKDTLILE